MENNGMTPSRPYIFRAIYQWLCDNGVTPYMAVDATFDGVIVPLDHVKDGQIVLNLAPHAIGYINIEDHGVSFSARFNGISKELYAPMPAIQALYAKENGQGMVFPPEDFSQSDADSLDNDEEVSLSSVDSSIGLASVPTEDASTDTSVSSETTSKTSSDKPKKDRSHLKIIK